MLKKLIFGTAIKIVISPIIFNGKREKFQVFSSWFYVRVPWFKGVAHKIQLNDINRMLVYRINTILEYYRQAQKKTGRSCFNLHNRPAYIL